MLKEMARVIELDLAFTEPSGIVVPNELRNAILSASRGADVVNDKIVLLLDASEPGAAFMDGLEVLTGQQTSQVDAVAVTKVDEAADGGIEQLEQAVRGLNADAPLFPVSVKNGAGMEAFLTYIFDRHDDGRGD